MEFVLQRTWIFSVLQIYNTSTGAVGPFCGRFKPNTSFVSMWNYLKCSILGRVGSHVVVYYNTSIIVERQGARRTEVRRTWTIQFIHVLAPCAISTLCPYIQYENSIKHIWSNSPILSLQEQVFQYRCSIWLYGTLISMRSIFSETSNTSRPRVSLRSSIAASSCVNLKLKECE